MAAPLTVQLRNAESSVLFMQQEHAKTLQGLHQELQKLQKKCAELTFELAMKSGSPDEEFYEKQQKLLEAQLREKTKDYLEAEMQVQKRDSKIIILEQQAKIQDRRHQDEIKQYQSKISGMTSELEQRSNSLAYMTTQLHQLKLRHQARDDTSPAERIGSPVPPKDKPHHVRRHKVRSSSIGLLPGENLRGHLRAVHPASIENADVLECTADAATKQFIVTTRHSGSASPHRPIARSRTEIMDLRPFLANAAGRDQDINAKPAPPILPPIAPHLEDGRHRPEKHPMFAKRTLHRSSSEFEISSKETLAVEKVCSVENDLRQIEQSKTD
ncbi:coiled-coil domain-containing protein 92-like [Asterias rubens]|uniref:coiled-coil domain-containing protein 92-like n=1 Tax=Asterias rubens TaxID=7604 RepID=UPI0014557728|nr:coiled-coil domain-containing protein 92-like [Asterias rubens]